MSVGVAAVAAGILGAIIGSFLNVVAYRLPRKESLLHPPSRCPYCGTPIKPYDNVPVLGWLWLRGKCRACGAPISWRYPAVELLTGVLCALCVLAYRRRQRRLGAAAARAAAGADHADRPRAPHHPERPVADRGGRRVVLLVVFDCDSLVENLIAGAAAGGFFLLAAIVYPAGMGMGDVKLAGVLGLFLGRAVVPAIFAALIAGIGDRRGDHRPLRRGRGPQEGHPVRPLARVRCRSSACSLATTSSTGTSTRSRRSCSLSR